MARDLDKLLKNITINSEIAGHEKKNPDMVDEAIEVTSEYIKKIMEKKKDRQIWRV